MKKRTKQREQVPLSLCAGGTRCVGGRGGKEARGRRGRAHSCTRSMIERIPDINLRVASERDVTPDIAPTTRRRRRVVRRMLRPFVASALRDQ